jgi:hypothetical protein
MTTFLELEELKVSCQYKIINNFKNWDEVTFKLDEAIREEKLNSVGIHDESKLKVNIVYAEGVKVKETFVRV